MEALEIRDADPTADAEACAAIYAPYVTATPISFEERPLSAAEMGTRIAAAQRAHAWLVAVAGGEVVGYAYAVRHAERPAYRWAADVSVYVDGEHRGARIGRRLYEELLPRLRRQGYQVACAGITLPNEASVGLHERLGFTRVGVSERIGWKLGAWHDVLWLQLELVPAAGPPAEPAAG